jgi:hypothetical protein
MAALDAMIAKLRKLPKIAELAAQESEPLVEAVMRKTAAAGTDPGGKPWPLKKDGDRALPAAASAVVVQAIGTVLRVSIVGRGYVVQNYLTKNRRQQLPDADNVPKAITEALVEGSRRAFAKAMGA